MDQRIDGVIPEHIKAVEIVIEGKGAHSQGPVKHRVIDIPPCATREPRCLNALPIQAFNLNYAVMGNVHTIVIVKSCLERIGIDKEDRNGQHPENDKILFHKLPAEAPLQEPPVKVRLCIT